MQQDTDWPTRGHSKRVLKQLIRGLFLSIYDGRLDAGVAIERKGVARRAAVRG